MDTTEAGIVDSDPYRLAHVVSDGSSVPVAWIRPGEPQRLETSFRYGVGNVLGTRQGSDDQVESGVEVLRLHW
jgi:hypothetical protein